MKVWSCSLIESSTSQKHLEKNASWCQLSRKVVLGCAGAYLSNISKDPLLPWSKRPPGGHQVNPAPIVITVIAIAFCPAKRDERFRWTGWTYENLETHRIQPTSRVKRHVEAWFVAQRHFRNVSHLISCRALYEFVACCIPAAIGVLNNRIYIIGLSGKCSWKRCFHLFSWPNFATVQMGLSEQ